MIFDLRNLRDLRDSMNCKMKIAVFCASANDVERVYFEDARELGRRIGESGWQLVYGGTNVGLMREVAEATMLYKGEVTGIIPECISKRGVAATGLDHLIIAPDMKERKHLLREHADAFIAMPGGWGTLEEITEVITLKQLGEHSKPIVFLNTAGFYNGFIDFIGNLRGQGFVSPAYDNLYFVSESVEGAIEYIRNYQPDRITSKYV